MRLLKKRWTVASFGLLALASAPSAFAEAISLTVAPIIGYQKIEQFIPSLHYTTMLTYGARVTAGVLLISGEGQYTRGTVKEVYPPMDQTATLDQVLLGIRSGFRIGTLLTLSGRAGGSATQIQNEQTLNGVTTVIKNSVKYAPYAGISARGRLSRNLSASADLVAIIPDVNHLGRTQYQAMAGFMIQFP